MFRGFICAFCLLFPFLTCFGASLFESDFESTNLSGSSFSSRFSSFLSTDSTWNELKFLVSENFFAPQVVPLCGAFKNPVLRSQGEPWVPQPFSSSLLLSTSGKVLLLFQLGNGTGQGNLPRLRVGVSTGQGTGWIFPVAIPGVPVLLFRRSRSLMR